jgi:sodium/potassium/calcium exchanger 6
LLLTLNFYQSQAPLSLYGFFIAATWIDVIGNYLVSLLQFLGIICRIPAPILGVTVLAWGNSLGDLSANLAMARKGAPDMATTANFAGPSFNLLVGMGCGFLSLQHKLHSTSIFPVSLTQSIRIGFSFNILNCLLIIICAICCQWRIPHRYSYVFFVLYAMFIAMSLMTLIRN